MHYNGFSWPLTWITRYNHPWYNWKCHTHINNMYPNRYYAESHWKVKSCWYEDLALGWPGLPRSPVIPGGTISMSPILHLRHCVLDHHLLPETELRQIPLLLCWHWHHPVRIHLISICFWLHRSRTEKQCSFLENIYIKIIWAQTHLDPMFWAELEFALLNTKTHGVVLEMEHSLSAHIVLYFKWRINIVDFNQNVHKVSYI